LARGVFVTGTDTGVGKTVIVAGLLRAIRDAGIDAIPMKPVQTGAERANGQLVSADLAFCLHVGQLALSADDGELMCPYRFETACSPHLAAEIAGTRIDLKKLAGCLQRLQAKHGAVIVEGAGGVLVPVNESETMLDLMRALDLPVLLVGKAGLGTINHTLLSLGELRRAGLDVAGVVLNSAEPIADGFIVKNNVETIERFGGVKVLGVLEALPASQLHDEIAQAFPRSVPGWSAVLDRLRQP
jgi:dethiobiotin synthetase